jgi:hypothetical protein
MTLSDLMLSEVGMTSVKEQERNYFLRFYFIVITTVFIATAFF